MPAELRDRLRSGSGIDDRDLLASIGSLLSSDTYGVVETLIRPVATEPCAANANFSHESIARFGLDGATGIPDSPRTQYYRAGESLLPVGVGEPRTSPTKDVGGPPEPQRFFHLVVPMEPRQVLDQRGVAAYESDLEYGGTPTAVGVSYLDVRTPLSDPDEGHDPSLVHATEWCLATFLLDGHHKVEGRAPLRNACWSSRVHRACAIQPATRISRWS